MPIIIQVYNVLVQVSMCLYNTTRNTFMCVSIVIQVCLQVYNVFIQISDAVEYDTWYTALMREGVSRQFVSGCTWNPMQVTATDMYEEITPLQSHQMSQALLYEEVGAVCDSKTCVIHEYSLDIRHSTHWILWYYGYS